MIGQNILMFFQDLLAPLPGIFSFLCGLNGLVEGNLTGLIGTLNLIFTGIGINPILCL